MRPDVLSLVVASLRLHSAQVATILIACGKTGITYEVFITLSLRLRDGRFASLLTRGVEALVLDAPTLALVLTEARVVGGGGVGPSEDN